MPSPEEQLQPHMESSTEAMDTDEVQQTSARLLEEAQCLSQARAEPTYTAIEEPTTMMTGGSEAIISDILSMQDPRELTLSEVGERRIAPLKMRAGLPTGSFSSFDFNKEFQARHGVRPEDANQPWHSYRSSRESSLITNPYDQETEQQLSEVSSTASPTRDMEVIYTPGITREEEYTERGPYTENVLTLDASLLQDIISGRWSREQLYGTTPSWYRDSFYNITQTWDDGLGGYEDLIGLASIYGHQSHPLPLGVFKRRTT